MSGNKPTRSKRMMSRRRRLLKRCNRSNRTMPDIVQLPPAQDPRSAYPVLNVLRPETASVLDPPYVKALRQIMHTIGMDNPTSQVLGLMMSDVPSTGEQGGLAGAIGRVFDRAKSYITAYHGSPHDFEQFSMSKIGTGEGAQAY